ncbi:MAG: hypothetical protein ACRCYU_04505 [Nocardioides sp.]
MTKASGWKIDWREQLSEILALRDHGAGGVVHIHAGAESPKAAFARVLRGELSSSSHDRSWRTVQIDPDNSNTHYLTDIVQQVSKSTGVSLVIPSSSPTVQVANNLEAGGALLIKDVTINAGLGASAVTYVEALCESLRKLLPTRRVAIIFMNTHQYSVSDLDRMMSVLWIDALENLVPLGLVVVDIFDPVEMACKNSSWPPDSTILLDLPSAYDDRSRIAAVEDIATLTLEKGMCKSSEQAEVFANAIVTSHQDIRSVHAGFTLAVNRLRT